MALNPIIINLLFDKNSNNRTPFTYSSNWKRSLFAGLNEQQFYEHFRILRFLFIEFTLSYTRKLLRFHSTNIK